MKRVLLAAVVIALAATAGFFAYSWRAAESRLDQQVEWARSVIDSLKSVDTIPARTSGTRHSLLDEADTHILTQAGLDEPGKQLLESLELQTALIPYDAVLGGTMGFHMMAVLPDGYAFVEFDDGHVQGYMLLSYDVGSGKISWHRLWATLL